MGMELRFHCGCGYGLSAQTGIGMNYPYLCREILEAMQSGEYGSNVREFANTAPHPGIFTDGKLYRCAQCGHLRNEPALSLCTPIGPYRKPTVPFCSWMDPEEQLPYVMEADLGTDWQEVLSRKHPCACGAEMEPVEDLNAVPCPRCGQLLNMQTDMMWD